MRILYLSQYFPPEVGATQTRAFEMASNWVQLGHSVTMVTEIPNHPSGIIPPGYRGKFFEKSKSDGIEIVRVWVITSQKKSFTSRMLFYLSYMVNAILAGLFFTKGKFDLVYASSPPLFVGAAALVLSFLKRIPMVFEVRDLWPESAVALGELNHPLAIKLAIRLEYLCYNQSIQIILMTKGNYKLLQSKGIPVHKLCVIPNGANTQQFFYNPLQRENFRHKLHLEGKFVAIYAGIHGIAQGLETILGAARILENDAGVHFVMIGEGPKKSELLVLAEEYKLRNITFLPEVPRKEIPGYLSMSDVALVPLVDAEIFNYVIPSKLFDAWACERPVLMSIDGEARELVERINGGIYVIPGNPANWAETITNMKRMPDELTEMGINGRRYTEQNHSRQLLARKLMLQLENLLATKDIKV